MKIYVPVYDFGWKIKELEPSKVQRFTGFSVCIDGLLYLDDALMRSKEAAQKYINREFVPAADRVTVEEIQTA